MRGWFRVVRVGEAEVVDLALFGLPALVFCTRRWGRLGMTGNILLIRGLERIKIDVSSRSPRCRHVIEYINIENNKFLVLDRVSDPGSILLNCMKSGTSTLTYFSRLQLTYSE